MLFFAIGLLLGTPAIVFGAVGRGKAKRGAPNMKLAMWGLGLGTLGAMLCVGFFTAVVCDCL